MRHSNKKRDNVTKSRPGANTVTNYTILLSGLAPVALVASLSLRQRICEMVWADQIKMFPSKRDYLTLTSVVSTNTIKIQSADVSAAV